MPIVVWFLSGYWDSYEGVDDGMTVVRVNGNLLLLLPRDSPGESCQWPYGFDGDCSVLAEAEDDVCFLV